VSPDAEVEVNKARWITRHLSDAPSVRTIALGSVALAVAVACSGCGSSSPSVPALRQQAQSVFKSTDTAFAKDAAFSPVKAYEGYAQAFTNAAQRIRALDVPASMRRDVDTLVAALDKLASDSTKLAKAEAKNQKVEKNVLAEAQLTLKMMEDEKTERVASDALRKELGLPPVPVTTTTTSTQPPGISSSPQG
jgi:hypothetical protein